MFCSTASPCRTKGTTALAHITLSSVSAEQAANLHAFVWNVSKNIANEFFLEPRSQSHQSLHRPRREQQAPYGQSRRPRPAPAALWDHILAAYPRRAVLL